MTDDRRGVKGVKKGKAWIIASWECPSDRKETRTRDYLAWTSTPPLLFPSSPYFSLIVPRERGDNARLGHDWTELSEPPAPGAWQPVTVFFLTSKNRLITRLPRERGGELINSRGKRAFFLRSGNLDEPVNFRRDAFLPAN